MVVVAVAAAVTYAHASTLMPLSRVAGWDGRARRCRAEAARPDGVGADGATSASTAGSAAKQATAAGRIFGRAMSWVVAAGKGRVRKVGGGFRVVDGREATRLVYILPDNRAPRLFCGLCGTADGTPCESATRRADWSLCARFGLFWRRDLVRYVLSSSTTVITHGAGTIDG